jgi:putative NADH-flavin reductase
MKLLLLGATGPSGQQIVARALEQGHEVTILVRNPSKLNFNDARLTVVTGDIFDGETLVKYIQGKDVVISALGVGKELKSNNLITRAVASIIPAMNTAGVKRLIFLSAFGVGPTYSQASVIQKIVFRTFLRNIYADKNAGSEQLRSSGLQWTLVSPVLMSDGPRTGKYRVGEKLEMKGMPKISRADIADFMLSEARDNRYVQRDVILSD